MMTDELDLERGDPDRSDAQSERAKRRAARRQRSTEEASKPGASDGEVSSRLGRVFERIAEAREARDDIELATVIREDADAMTQGFISITSNVPFLRMPLIMALNVFEPLLAFSRVGRILLWRFLERRQRRMAARMAEQGEMVPDEYFVPVDGQPVESQ
jgi:hypothetical protein